MKNTLKLASLTTDSRRVSGDINRTGTTFLIITIALIAVLGCTKQNGQTIHDPNFSIYGVWRYVGSADVEHGETWHDNSIDLITIYDANGRCVIAIGNSVYNGVMHKRDSYSHQFNAHNHLDLESGESADIVGQGSYTFAFNYDPAAKRLIDADGTVERYFEWVKDATVNPAPPQTAVKKMPPVQIRLVTSHDTLETVNIIGEYDDTNRNEGKAIVLWTDITVRYFEFISLDFDYEKDGYFAESGLYSIDELQPGKMFLVNFPWIGDGMPSRGIMFLDKNNIRRFFYIGESGMDGSLSLNEFQNAHPVESPAETDAYEPVFENESMKIEATEIIINNIGNNITGNATVVVLVASSRGMVATVAKGRGIISDKTLAVKLSVSDDYDMLNTPDKSPEKGSYYIGLIIPPDETNIQIYGDYESVVFDRGIVKLDYRKFKL